MKNKWTLFFVILFAPFCLLRAQTVVRPVIPDSLIKVWTKPDFPGGVVAVVRNDSIFFKQAFGLSSLEKNEPLTTEHSFDLASIAKQFTGMCIALLAEAGTLDVNDDIRKYYPDFSYEQGITIQNLLSHSSGIRDGYVLMMLAGKTNLFGKLKRKYDEKQLIFDLLSKQTALNFEPGSEMAYTNVNYVILGDIVERISGQSLRQFADSAIFKPLGMKHTVFRDSKGVAIKSLAHGYHAQGKGKWKEGKLIGGIVGDHNLISTIDDLILWTRNFGHNRLGRGTQHLIETITTPDTLNDRSPLSYNYGLETGDYKGYKYVAHGGDNGLHTSFLIWFPEDNLSIVHLANHSEYRFTVDGAYTLANTYLGEKTQQGKEETFEILPMDPTELKQWEGTYSFIAPNGLGQVRKLTERNGKLYCSFHPESLGQEIRPVGSQRFVIKPATQSPVFFSFVRSQNGGQVTMTESQDERKTVFSRLDESQLVADLKTYRGKYVNPELGTRMKVKTKKKKLVMTYKSIVRFDMFRIAPNTFYMPEAPAIVVFRDPSSSSPNSMTVNAPDFRNFELRKEN
jgi:CubicO group peptidase (beta-lactamase class C family)